MKEIDFGSVIWKEQSFFVASLNFTICHNFEQGRMLVLNGNRSPGGGALQKVFGDLRFETALKSAMVASNTAGIDYLYYDYIYYVFLFY